MVFRRSHHSLVTFPGARASIRRLVRRGLDRPMRPSRKIHQPVETLPRPRAAMDRSLPGNLMVGIAFDLEQCPASYRAFWTSVRLVILVWNGNTPVNSPETSSSTSSSRIVAVSTQVRTTPKQPRAADLRPLADGSRCPLNDLGFQATDRAGWGMMRGRNRRRFGRSGDGQWSAPAKGGVSRK